MAPPFRVAHLTASLETGGRERTVAQLCTSRTGDIVITFEADRPLAPFANHLKPRTLDRTKADFADRLRQILSRESDIVHAHGPVAAIYAARALPPEVRLIVTIHADLRSDWRAAKPIWQALRQAGAVSAVSGNLARQVARFTRRPCEIIPSAIDVTVFRAGARPERKGAALQVGTAGRLHPVKRQGDLISAVRMAGRDIALVIAGAGAEYESLFAQARGSNCRFLGAVGDMNAYYRALDLFVLCSAHEGTPLALLEAMAAGLPCIATWVGGIPEIARGECDGVSLVPPRRPDLLAQAIRSLADSPERRRRMAAAARRRAATFDLPAQQSRYESLYRAALARSAEADDGTARNGGAVPAMAEPKGAAI